MARLPYIMAYDPDFLGGGYEVPLPKTCCKGKLFKNGEVIDYIHFSLVMHQDRRSALYTAHNIDVSQKRSASRTRWDLDSRIDNAHQTGNEAYRNNDWDRGHLVRRSSVAWGSSQEAQDASDSTFYYPVAALQHSTFNQSNSKWLGLEDWILQKAGSFATRLCVFTGPIYTEVDLEERGYQIPSAFWKIVVLRDPTAEGEDLAALGFIMKQNENWRSAGQRALTNLEPFHVSIAEIEAYTGLRFGAIAQLDEFDWRQVRFRNRALMPAIPINGPDDIHFSGDRRRAGGIRAFKRFSSGSELATALETKRLSHSSATEHDCGCKDRTMDLQKEVRALKAQTSALCEIVERLMENNQGNFKEESIGSLRTLMERIIGGQIVQPSEFPDCVAIGDEDGYFCSGILVHNKIVLTAAHCAVYPITKVFLKGRQLSSAVGAEIIEVESVFVHPDYSPNQIPQHDIAVLILKEEATVVPREIATKEEVAEDDSLLLVGFGSDSPDGMAGFGTKRKVNVPLTNTTGFTAAKIVEIQQKHGYDVAYEFHGGLVRSGKDTCNGDSGGPAYIEKNGVFKVAGLTSRAAASFIDLCGDGGVYTQIDAYSIWLHEVTGGLIGMADTTVPVVTETSDGSGLYISATMPNPSGADSGNEWVEITNASNNPINLEGYRLQDKQGGRLNLIGNINSGATLRVIIPADSSIKLGNSGDEIKLIQDDKTIHEVSYPRATSGEAISFESPYKDAPKVPDCKEKKDTHNCGGCVPVDDDCSGEIDPDFTPGATPC